MTSRASNSELRFAGTGQLIFDNGINPAFWNVHNRVTRFTNLRTDIFVDLQLDSDLDIRFGAARAEDSSVGRLGKVISGPGKLTLTLGQNDPTTSRLLKLGSGGANSYEGGTEVRFIGSTTYGSGNVIANTSLLLNVLASGSFGTGDVVLNSQGLNTTAVEVLTTSTGGLQVQFSANNVMASTATLTQSGAGAGLVLLGATQQAMAGLVTTDAGESKRINSSAGSSLTLQTAAGTTYSYGGRILGGLDLTISGTGMQSLTGTNTYTGLTTLAGGTLALGSADAMNGGGTVTFTGGTVRHSNADGATIDLGSRIRNSSSAVKVDTFGNDVSYVAIDSSNLAGLEKFGNGTLTLAGANTYAGNSTVAAGTLRIGTGSTAGSILGDVALSAAAATLAFDRADEIAFAGAITGSGQLRKAGAGRLTLSSAASTYSGGTFVDAGTLAVTAANALGTGNVTVANGARLRLDVSPALGGNAINLLSGSEFVTTGGISAPLAAGASLTGWRSTSTGGTAASLLQSTAFTATTFATGWDTNPGDYLSDILTLSGTTASVSNVMVLSMAYDPAYSGALTDLNIFTRPNSAGAFAAVGSSFEGVGVPWTASFQTPGQYGVSDGRVWAVTDANSQFVVDVMAVPEPGALAIAAWGSVAAGLYFRRRRLAR
jgi:autotransporter-associated beta strand protein